MKSQSDLRPEGDLGTRRVSAEFAGYVPTSISMTRGRPIGLRLFRATSFLGLGSRACTCATAAEEIKASGLRVKGIGGDLSTEAEEVASLS